MSQFNAPIRRSGGEIDVYTGLLCAAFLVLLTGVILLAARNTGHSAAAADNQPGGMFTLVGK